MTFLSQALKEAGYKRRTEGDWRVVIAPSLLLMYAVQGGPELKTEEKPEPNAWV